MTLLTARARLAAAMVQERFPDTAAFYRELADTLEQVTAERDAYREALEHMLTHPFVMDGDNAAVVASWFVHEAKGALAARASGDTP